MHSTATSGSDRFDRLADVDAHFHAQLASSVDNGTDVLPDLERIDVDSADDPKAFARGDLLCHGGTNRSETDVEDADHGRIIGTKAAKVRGCAGARWRSASRPSEGSRGLRGVQFKPSAS